VEWVETASKSIEEAKDLLLDQLGVDEDEAEFEILEEPKVGLFGRARGQARVRARIKPKSPRQKDERRRRNGNKTRTRAKGDASTTSDRGSKADTVTETNDEQDAPDETGAPAVVAEDRRPQNGRERRPRRDDSEPVETADPAEIATAVDSFLAGLVTAFGVEAATSTEVVDGEVLAYVDGEGLGLLIGPKGGVVDAIQELSRTFSQKESKGRQAPKLRVDVGRYRENRKIELEACVRDVAEKVLESGDAYAFEPMGSADRKTVHDTASSIEGLATVSEGEDPRRKVVIVRA
jgi:spoIIIJ-associated protein